VDYKSNREKKLKYAACQRASQAKLQGRPYNPRKIRIISNQEEQEQEEFYGEQQEEQESYEEQQEQ